MVIFFLSPDRPFGPALKDRHTWVVLCLSLLRTCLLPLLLHQCLCDHLGQECIRQATSSTSSKMNPESWGIVDNIPITIKGFMMWSTWPSDMAKNAVAMEGGE